MSVKLFFSFFFITLSNLSQDHENNHTTVTSITLSPHLTELVYSAGGQDSLVGVSAYSNFPEEVKNLPIIGDAFRLDYEMVKTLNPDVIFYWQNGTAGQVVQHLKDQGYQLHEISIDHLNDIPKAISEISSVLKTQPTEATEKFEQRLNSLQLNTTTRQALIQISAKPIYTVNDKHWMSEAIGVCGLKNVFDDLEPLSAAVTLESVVLKKPDVIITTGLMPDNPLKEWSSIPAVKNNLVIDLNPDTFSRPTLRLLDAIEDLCQQVKN
jgi:iron complex transport system substrate-binding protein